MHWQPNFNECWWDHILVDVLVCNAFGIFVATAVLRRAGLREFDWLGCGAAADWTEWERARRSQALISPHHPTNKPTNKPLLG